MKTFAIIISSLLISINLLAQFGEEHVISNLAYQATDAKAADLDNDGDLDVVASHYESNQVVWYENDGFGNFGDANVLSTIQNGAVVVDTADLNNDGNIDVISVSVLNSKLVCFINDGNGNFSDQHFITTSTWEPSSVFAGDLDQDGDIDILSASYGLDKIFWYKNDGNANFEDQPAVSSAVNQPSSVFASDIDGDGDLDVISGSQYDNKIAWYENYGNGTFGPQQVITFLADWVLSVYATDIDGDGDNDVLSASRFDDKIAWYRNDGNGNFDDQIVISTAANDPSYAITNDLDGDGDLDILSSSMSDDKIAWYENDGVGNFGEQQIISTNANTAWSVFAFDADGDGDDDVLSASVGDDKVAWYESHFAGCTDPLACNYESSFTMDNGSCCFEDCGCTNPDAFNYSSTATCDDGSCIFMGCTDPIACNYDPDANTDDGSCNLPDGCTDPEALNYMSSAICDNGLCIYRIDGLVYYDANENGILDDGENGLSSQEVILEPAGLISFTNSSGEFFFMGVGLGSYSLSHTLTSAHPFPTTPDPIIFEVAEGGADEDLTFGVSDVIPSFAIEVILYPSANGYFCDELENHKIFYSNMGSVAIDGIVALEFDSLFQGYEEVTPIDSVIGNNIYMSFDNLLPGELIIYEVLLHTPTEDYLGEFLTSSAEVYGYYDNEQVAYGESTLIHELTCSHDPNDKQVFPLGYEEPHYIVNDTELEYIVRFQNTGNATATNVLIKDTIDEHLDLSTFSVIANSHSVMTSINTQTRVVDFYFENIFLPDSTADELGSHGLISYNIRPIENLAIDTEINNTAYIYFDNNSPIITNTTWSTIFDCNSLVGFLNEPISICGEGELSLGLNVDYIEGFVWYVNGELESTDSQLTQFYEEGEYTIDLYVSNPICESQGSYSFVVNPIPDAQISLEGMTLVASEANSYQWYLDGTAIEEAVSQSYTISEDGNYSVELTNEFACSEMSDEIFATTLPELDSKSTVLYPNPMSEISYLFFEEDCSNCTVRLISSNGQIVRQYNSIEGNSLSIERKGMTSGLYVLQILRDEAKKKEFILIVEQ